MVRPSSSIGAEANPISKYQKVSTGRRDARSGVSLKTKPEHATFYADKPLINQEIMTPAPNTQALEQTAYFSFILENKTGGVIKDASLRFSLQFERKNGQPYGPGCKNAVQPVTQWFERIEWIDRMTGEEIARYHGDVLHMLFNTQSQEDLKAVEDMVNIDRCTGRTTGRQYRQNEIVYFYLPLLYHWWDDLDIDLGALQSDIEIRFYPRGTVFVEDQAALGDAGFKANLLELRMIQESAMYPGGFRVDLRNKKRSEGQIQNYVDFQQYIDFGRYFVPGQEYTIDLDQFHNDSAALFFLLRKSGAQRDAAGLPVLLPSGQPQVIDPYKGKQLYKFESLGEQGTIDHENVQGRSLFGDGTPVDELFFRRRYPTELFNNDYAKANSVYVVPFSNDLKGVLDGVIDGFHRFRGDRERLRIRTGPAPVPSVVKYYFQAEGIDAIDAQAPGDLILNSVEVQGSTVHTLVCRYKGKNVALIGNGVASLNDAGELVAAVPGDSPFALANLKEQLNETNILEADNLQISKITAVIASNPGGVSASVDDLTFRSITSEDANGGLLPYNSLLSAPLAADEFYYRIEMEVTDLDGQPEVQHGNNLPKMFEFAWTVNNNLNSLIADAGQQAVGTTYLSNTQLATDAYTPGKRGFNAGVYDVTLYSAYYRTITEAGGKLKSSDVVN